jgi:hypothetical protein
LEFIVRSFDKVLGIKFKALPTDFVSTNVPSPSKGSNPINEHVGVCMGALYKIVWFFFTTEAFEAIVPHINPANIHKRAIQKTRLLLKYLAVAKDTTKPRHIQNNVFSIFIKY